MPRTSDARLGTIDDVARRAASNQFYPKATVRCADDAVFRTQLARDLACLLDVDEHVVAWSTLPAEIAIHGRFHIPDLMVTYSDGVEELLDAVDRDGDAAVTEAFACAGRRHRFVRRADIVSGFRLQNAKDILRYAWCRTPLNDRVRLLAAVDEAGSLRISEVLPVFREIQPMTAISSMILHRYLSADLDEAPIGPETVIRRFQR